MWSSNAWERRALWDFPSYFGVELQWCHAGLPRRVRPFERPPRYEHALAQASDLVEGGWGGEGACIRCHLERIWVPPVAEQGRLAASRYERLRRT